MIAYIRQITASEQAKRMAWALVIMAIAYFVIMRGDHFLIPPSN